MSGLNCELYPVGPNQALTKDYLQDIVNLNTAVSNVETSITEIQVESDALLVDIDATLLEITTNNVRDTAFIKGDDVDNFLGFTQTGTAGGVVVTPLVVGEVVELVGLQSGEYLLTLNIEATISATTVPDPVLQYIEVGLGTTQITKPFSQRYYGPTLTTLLFCYTVPFTATTPTLSILMLPTTNTEFCGVTVSYDYSLTKINQLY